MNSILSQHRFDFLYDRIPFSDLASTMEQQRWRMSNSIIVYMHS